METFAIVGVVFSLAGNTAGHSHSAVAPGSEVEQRSYAAAALISTEALAPLPSTGAQELESTDSEPVAQAQAEVRPEDQAPQLIEQQKSETPFPVIELPGQPETISEAFQSLLSASEVIGSIGGQVSSASPIKNAGWLIATSKEIWTLNSEYELSRSSESDDWTFERCAIQSQGRTLDCDDSEVARQLNGSKSTSLNFYANWMWPLKRGFLKSESVEREPYAGVPTSTVIDSVLARRFRKQESTLATVPGQLVDRFVVDPSETLALCALDEFDPEDYWFESKTLAEVNLQTGETSKLGSWPSVQFVALAQDNWLISGQPSDGPGGIYTLERGKQDPQHKLVISATSAIGIDLREDALLFSYLDRSMEHVIVRTPLPVIAEYGPACDPFYTQLLNQLAADSEPATGMLSIFETQAALDAFLERANKLSIAQVGQVLPRKPREVDLLFEKLNYDFELNGAGLALVAALLTQSLRDQGATVLDGPIDALDILAFAQDTWRTEHTFAISPLTVTQQSLLTEDGWWDPVQSMLDIADGRTLLIGSHAPSVDAAALAFASGNWREELPAWDANQIAEFLLNHESNRHLRKLVYQELGFIRRTGALAQVAKLMANSDAATALDHSAWLGAIAGTEPSVEHQKLTEAIVLFPTDPALYVLLGKHYEREGDRMSAVSCYEKALDLDSWGAANEAATFALDQMQL